MIITKKISDRFARSLVESKQISPEYEEAYSYCVDFVLDLLVFNLSLLLIGGLVHNFYTALVYIISLTPLKMVAGGAHANSRLMCSVISYTSFGLIVFISCIISPNLYFMIPAFLISVVFIVFLSPVEHKNKRFDKEGKKKLKKLSIVFSIILTIAFFVLLKLSLLKYCLTMSLCVLTIFVNQLIGLITFNPEEN